MTKKNKQYKPGQIVTICGIRYRIKETHNFSCSVCKEGKNMIELFSIFLTKHKILPYGQPCKWCIKHLTYINDLYLVRLKPKSSLG